MMTIVEALKELTEKLGGTDADSRTIVEALKGIYAAYGGESDVSGVDTISGMIEQITSVAEAGGSGDLSTATVTFVYPAIAATDILAGVFENDNSLSYPTTNQPIQIGGPIVVSPTVKTMILYKGHAELAIDYDPDFMTATGGAVWVADNEAFDVTGDCTITLTAE